MVIYIVHPRCHDSRSTGIDGGHHGQSSARGHRPDDLDGAIVAVRQSCRPKGHAEHFHYWNWIRSTGRDDDADLFQIA